jgi:hypothetical protein
MKLTPPPNHIRILLTIASFLFIITGTALTIQFAKGYRPTKQGTIQPTGLLSATSNPVGAQVYIDKELANKVTNDTINLTPGEYEVEIRKEGFTTWKKTLTLTQEVVTETDANLFRTVPSITPLTFTGAENITPSPDGQKLAYTVASSSAETKAGLYVLELTDKPILFAKGPKLIAANTAILKFNQAKFIWSPDSDELLASLPNITFRLNISGNNQDRMVDITPQLTTIFTTWEQDVSRRQKQLLLQLPEPMLKIATQSAKNLYFSPDGFKLIYTATQSATIPDKLINPLPGSNTQSQARRIDPNNVYVYDLKEDKNFLLIHHPTELPANPFTKITLYQPDITSDSLFTNETATSASKLQDPKDLEHTFTNFASQYSPFPQLNYQWFPSSKHILVNQSGSINITEYDGTNFLGLYSGDFKDNFFIASPNGSKLIILANPTNNPTLPANLYAINLK